MTKDEARKEAIEKANEIIFKDEVCIRTIDDSFVVQCSNGDGHVFPFDPPKPEFEKGTIGLDNGGEICFYKELNSHGDYLLTTHKISLENGRLGGYTSSAFSPIYQNDPKLERAFALATNRVGGNMTCERCNIAEFCREGMGKGLPGCNEVFRAYFLSKAEKELK